MMRHCDGPILVAILVGTVVRAYAFGDVPPGMHQDEVSAGYDAYALLYYGIDRNGFHNPAGLIAWGSGMFALVSYVAMPFIALLGLTPIAVRLPFLILGVASILMLAWLVKEIHGRTAAHIAALLLAISPGPILMSRWALDANLLPPVLLAGVLTAVLALRRPWLLPLSFAFFGLSPYAYGTAYITVPVMLAMIVPYASAHRRMSVGPLAVVLTGGRAGGRAGATLCAGELLQMGSDRDALVEPRRGCRGPAVTRRWETLTWRAGVSFNPRCKTCAALCGYSSCSPTGGPGTPCPALARFTSSACRLR